LPPFVQVIRLSGSLSIRRRRNKRCNDPQPLDREMRGLLIVPRDPQLGATGCANDVGAGDMNEFEGLGADSSVDVPCSAKRPVAARVVEPLRVKDEFTI